MAQQTNDVQQAEPMPIDVKQAVQAAMQYVKELYREEEIPNLRLEEVEMSEDGKLWLVTVGFTSPERVLERESLSPFGGTFGTTATTTKRDYKLIQVDALTGKPVRMKIRTV